MGSATRVQAFEQIHSEDRSLALQIIQELKPGISSICLTPGLQGAREAVCWRRHNWTQARLSRLMDYSRCADLVTQRQPVTAAQLHDATLKVMPTCK